MLLIPDSKISCTDNDRYVLNDPKPDILLFSLFILFSFNIDRTPAFIHILVLRRGGIFFKQTDLFLSKIFENLHGLLVSISADEVKPVIVYHGNSAGEGHQTYQNLTETEI
jgi:hypothetical protein